MYNEVYRETSIIIIDPLGSTMLSLYIEINFRQKLVHVNIITGMESTLWSDLCLTEEKYTQGTVSISLPMQIVASCLSFNLHMILPACLGDPPDRCEYRFTNLTTSNTVLQESSLART